VRQSLEKVWDLGLRIGHEASKHLSRDFLRLTQIPEVVLKPIRSAIQRITQGESLEPTLERTLIPRPGPHFDR